MLVNWAYTTLKKEPLQQLLNNLNLLTELFIQLTLKIQSFFNKGCKKQKKSTKFKTTRKNSGALDLFVY